MCRRIVAFVPTLLPTMICLAVSTSALTTIALRPAHADECISKPYAKAPQGYHWYYYTVDDHRCWILRSAEDSALVSDVTHKDVQDVEADAPAATGDSERRLPPLPQATRPIMPKPMVHAPTRLAAQPARSRFPTASDAATSQAEPPARAANVPAAAFITRWPNDFNVIGANMLMPVAATDGASASNARATAQGAVQEQTARPVAQMQQAPVSSASAAPIAAAGVMTLEPLPAFLRLHSEHSVALITAALSLLTIAAGVSVAARRSRRHREIEHRRAHWSADAAPIIDVDAGGCATPRPVRVLDAPPMFHEPTNERPAPQADGYELTSAFENTLHKLLHELESRRARRARAVNEANAKPRQPTINDLDYWTGNLRRV